jgi:hypothetical protein
MPPDYAGPWPGSTPKRRSRARCELMIHLENPSNRYSSLDIPVSPTGIEKVSVDDMLDKCKNKYKDYLAVELTLYPQPAYFIYYCDWAYNRPNRPYSPSEVLGVGVLK